MAESKQPPSGTGPNANAVYSLGSTEDERARLQRQADELLPVSAALLDRVGLRPGQSAIDLGCGPRGVLDLLVERVSPDGRVVGLDADPASVAMAAEFAAERGLADVEVLEGDARHTGLPSGAFNVAHTRTLLVTIPRPAEVVAERVRLVIDLAVLAARHELDRRVQRLASSQQRAEPGRARPAAWRVLTLSFAR